MLIKSLAKETKQISDAIKMVCRFLCRPLLPILPDRFINCFPFLGRVIVTGPDQLRVQFHTHSPYGKDRIAIKLARRGLDAYEGETIKVFMQLIKNATTIIDIGANTGLFTLLAARANPACKVIAFEPVPFIYEMLQKNIHLNDLRNISAVPLAVAASAGETTLYITKTSVGIPTDSSLCQGFREHVTEHRVKTISIDEYVQQQMLNKIDIIKIDVEAAEEQVFAGALATLKRDRPTLICEVLPDLDHRKWEAMLASLDYTFYHITPDGLVPHTNLLGSLDGQMRNYLFLHKDAHILS